MADSLLEVVLFVIKSYNELAANTEKFLVSKPQAYCSWNDYSVNYLLAWLNLENSQMIGL